MTSITNENKNYKTELKEITAKPLLWIGLVSIVMFFSGLTSAVIVIKSDLIWNGYDFPIMFLFSTIIIIASSLSFHIGLNAVKKDKTKISNIAFAITLFLGLAFGLSQYIAWTELYANGIVFSGGSSIDSFLYVLTGMHFAHMIGGLISLIVVIIKSVKGKYSSINYHLLALFRSFMVVFILFLKIHSIV